MCSDWLLKLGISRAITSKQHQTCISYEQNGYLVPYCNKQRILQLNEEAVPEKHEEGNEIRLVIFTGKALSV